MEADFADVKATNDLVGILLSVLGDDYRGERTGFAVDPELVVGQFHAEAEAVIGARG